MAGVDMATIVDIAAGEEGDVSALHGEVLGVGVVCAIRLSEQDELRIGVGVLVQPQTGVEVVLAASKDKDDSDEQLPGGCSPTALADPEAAVAENGVLLLLSEDEPEVDPEAGLSEGETVEITIPGPSRNGIDGACVIGQVWQTPPENRPSVLTVTAGCRFGSPVSSPGSLCPPGRFAILGGNDVSADAGTIVTTPSGPAWQAMAAEKPLLEKSALIAARSPGETRLE